VLTSVPGTYAGVSMKETTRFFQVSNLIPLARAIVAVCARVGRRGSADQRPCNAFLVVEAGALERATGLALDDCSGRGADEGEEGSESEAHCIGGLDDWEKKAVGG
jgi:hypothetical protein